MWRDRRAVREWSCSGSGEGEVAAPGGRAEESPSSCTVFAEHRWSPIVDPGLPRCRPQVPCPPSATSADADPAVAPSADAGPDVSYPRPGPLPQRGAALATRLTTGPVPEAKSFAVTCLGRGKARGQATGPGLLVLGSVAATFSFFLFPVRSTGGGLWPLAAFVRGGVC
jgi:hypothetical protein